MKVLYIYKAIILPVKLRYFSRLVTMIRVEYFVFVSELYFLILRYLESGPCREAAKVFTSQIKFVIID